MGSDAHSAAGDEPAITAAVVQHVARLADLDLSPTEVTAMAQHLAAILKHVQQLHEVDTTGVEPASSICLEHLPFRDDALTPGLSQTAALAGSARSDGGGFAVPTFVEDP
jgi:aspartyl/glutamyl-tRNA(Asn/Gln) amidotransferase C subunit